MKNEKPNWDTLFEMFQNHIESAVDKQLNERIESLKKEQSKKLFYSLDECEAMLGLSRRALKARHKRGTLKLHYFNSNTLLMPAKEFDRLVEQIKKSE